MNITFEKINKANLEMAVFVQNRIFPKESARFIYTKSIEDPKFMKELDYYLVYLGDKMIGVTGIYSYYEYPEIAWLGWYGILEEDRHNGYGAYVLDWTMEFAKYKGYKEFRLYTDQYAVSAHKLYKSRGLVPEAYTNPLDIKNNDIEIIIYSGSLTGDSFELWNNKDLNLRAF